LSKKWLFFAFKATQKTACHFLDLKTTLSNDSFLKQRRG